MTNSVLPKVFEGFPELVNRVENLESAFDRLSERITAKKLEKRPPAQPFAAPPGMEVQSGDSQKSREQRAQLEAEVAEWKDKYETLAARFETEIALAAPAAPATQDEANQDPVIDDLRQSKQNASDEIARLAAQLSAVRRELDAAHKDFASAQDANQVTIKALEAKINHLQSERDAAQHKVAASEAARKQAADRVSALIESLTRAQPQGAS
ncbi:MAG: hypothetical protein AAF607_01180 [Pseudomonadota bacterium]